MATTEREKKRLREYEKRLKVVDDKLAELGDLQREAKGLRQIIAGLRHIVGDDDTPSEPAPDTGQKKVLTFHSTTRKMLVDYLQSTFADGQEHNVAQLMRGITASEDFKENPPSRGTVANRLAELDEAGYLKKVGRGTFVRASSNGSDPAAAATFPDFEAGASETPTD
jgi:hypothetical protein